VPLLTDRLVTQAKPAPSRLELPDSLVPGLRLVLQPSGRRSWAVRYRLNGRTAKYTLGSFPVVGVAMARGLAREKLQQVALGIDPVAAERGKTSVAAAVEAYTAKHVAGLRLETRTYATRELARILEAWGSRPVAAITKQDVRAFAAAAEPRGPAAAACTLKCAKAFLQWCAVQDLIDRSPAADVPNPARPKPRDRVLTDGELAAVWHACPDHPYGRFVRLLILTGCRKSEIGRLQWSEIDGNMIRLPGERTKTGVAHTVPITPAMRKVLDGCPKAGPYVLNGRRPIPGGGQAKAVIRTTILPWTLHDLRRSFVTGCAGLGIAPHIIERCVNHALPGVAAIYQRASFAVECLAAFEAWSAHVTRITR